MKVQFTKLVKKTIDIDFEKIFNYVKEDMEKDGLSTKNHYVVLDTFINNIYDYLEKIYGYKGKYNIHNDYAEELVYDNFSEWIKANK